jgi:uncharacterized membrane protein YcaP (DUF421 family)
LTTGAATIAAAIELVTDCNLYGKSTQSNSQARDWTNNRQDTQTHKSTTQVFLIYHHHDSLVGYRHGLTHLVSWTT